jgi:hypothetical protein
MFIWRLVRGATALYAWLGTMLGARRRRREAL